MKSITFTSVLNIKFLEKLKTLLFFNPEQQKIVTGILASIEKYGLPKIEPEGENIVIKVGELTEVQSIYAIDNEELVGVMLFFRETAQNITLLHIAVAEEHSLQGNKGNKMIALQLIYKLKEIAAKIKDVKTISIYYQKDVLKKIKI
eukprot:Anaeramoba_ignava/a617238_6.p1 GENE.a617238_6~~a617238_6.p1  ORF type:complete len:147 (-),score=20.09 a617238_6:128-568(-)